jgi:hypothetical protein
MLKEFADKLDGCESMSKSDIQYAKENDIVIVYGASDDLIEFDGAISDEGDCYNGGDVLVRKSGIIHNVEECEEAINTLKENGFDGLELSEITSKITSIWCPDYVEFDGFNVSGFTWNIETKIPHEKFKMYEDGDVYSVGIVFKKSDLK